MTTLEMGYCDQISGGDGGVVSVSDSKSEVMGSCPTQSFVDDSNGYYPGMVNGS